MKNGRKRARKAAAHKCPVPHTPEGWHSKAKPNLQAFVETHLQEQSLDSERDKYDVPAFDQAIGTLIGYD